MVDFEILAQYMFSGIAALFTALMAMLIWQMRMLSAGQKQLQRELHERTAWLSAKIDDTRKELSAEISEVRKDLSTEIGGVRKDLGAKADANHEAAYARMGEYHRQNLALYQGLAASVERLDGKVEAMSEFLRALLGGKALQEIAARQQTAGKAA